LKKKKFHVFFPRMVEREKTEEKSAAENLMSQLGGFVGNTI